MPTDVTPTWRDVGGGDVSRGEGRRAEPLRISGRLRAGPPPPVDGGALLGDDAVADRAQLLDRDLDHVAGLHPHRWRAGEADTARRPGGDDVSWRQTGEGREELDGGRNVDEHLRSARRLHHGAVEG